MCVFKCVCSSVCVWLTQVSVEVFSLRGGNADMFGTRLGCRAGLHQDQAYRPDEYFFSLLIKKSKTMDLIQVTL